MTKNLARNITLESDLSLVDDLASLERYGQLLALETEDVAQRNRLVAAMKTVSTFSHLIGRKMHLKPSALAYTDGIEIGAPVDHPYFYEFVEHEISHNLFKSNFEAKKNFCEQYVLQVSKALAAFGTVMSNDDRNHLAMLVGTVLNIIEDHRVNSLWAMLYPGSYRRLEEYSRACVEKRRKNAHDDIVGFFLCVAYSASKIPPGVFERFEPAMVASLKKVERKGPGSTFVVGKWLMTQIVSEMIRITKKLPPPPKAGKSSMRTDLDDMGDMSGMGDAGDAGDDGDDGDDGDGDDAPDAGDGGASKGPSKPSKSPGKPTGADPADKPDDAAQFSSAPPPAGTQADAGSGAADWVPPKVDATPEERIDAFKKLLDAARLLGSKGSKAPMQDSLDRVNNDKPTAASVASASDARKLVADAYSTDVTNAAAFDGFLDKSEADMTKVMDKIRDALDQAHEPSEQDWCSRNIRAKVVFKDVTSRRYVPPPMAVEDRRTVVRMREIFHRVKNRAAKTLAEDGVEIDVQALIAHKVSGQAGPVFRNDVSGRGFKALVLTDRSSSMQGEPSLAVERAARILRGSLKMPHVEFHSWGFHGQGKNVHLTRISPALDVSDNDEMPATGTTPMASSIRVAVNWLSTGYEKKQLILLTDGEPDASDVLDGETDRFLSVQRELRRAVKMGVNVTTLVIGNGIGDAEARTMFGHDRHWARVKAGRNHDGLTKSLVDLVSRSLIHHLKNG